MAHHSLPSTAFKFFKNFDLNAVIVFRCVLMQCRPCLENCWTILIFTVVWRPRVLRILFVALGQKGLYTNAVQGKPMVAMEL